MNNTFIIILFLFTAAGGLTLLSYVIRDKKRPMYLVALHGILAIVSYGLLSFVLGAKDARFLSNPRAPLENYAFVFFSLAAMGGLYMLVRDKILSKGIPKWIPFIHGGLAATGLIILIIATFMKS